MAPFDIRHTSSYWRSAVSMAVSLSFPGQSEISVAIASAQQRWRAILI